MFLSLTSVLRQSLRQNLRHFGELFVSSELVERIFWLQSSKVVSGPRTEADAASSRASKPTFGGEQEKVQSCQVSSEKAKVLDWSNVRRKLMSMLLNTVVNFFCI